uniref:Uncharacterized protein n=1 Tax=Glossina austeni TaxID=7395 RepID=A0A1A9UX70_GLOAU
MSIIDSGRYRLRKDWASVSIPSLVDIDEHADDDVDETDNTALNITSPVPQNAQKPPRRSSLALRFSFVRLLRTALEKTCSSSLRRVPVEFRLFVHGNSSKESYESAVKHEKSDGSNASNSPELAFNSDENIRSSSPNEPDKMMYFDNDGNANGQGGIMKNLLSAGGVNGDAIIDKERYRRRRSSLQTKLDRRRRKNVEISFPIPDQSLGSQSDLTNDGSSAIGSSSGDITCDDIEPNHSAYYPRQKRHSWWNIFIPDNMKNSIRRQELIDL